MQQAVFWYERRTPRARLRLTAEVRADAVVVGGGVAGLSCAQRLRASGLSVVLLERDFCGSGASGRSSGFVTEASEIELRSLLAQHGAAEARRIWEFVSSGVERIRTNIEDHGFDCDFQVQDSLFVANDRSGARSARREHEARIELGYESRFYETARVPEVLGTERYSAAVRFGGTFGIDPFAYCQALRDLIASQGVDVYEDSRVTALRADGVDTADGAVRASHVIVCTDRFLPELGAFEREVYHVQTFLGISSPLPEEALRRVFLDRPALVWDSQLVYDYFRVAGRDRLLLGGGDLLRTYARAQETDLSRFARRAVESFRSKFPDVVFELEFVWPGMLGVSQDFLPVMGPDPLHGSIWYVGAATGLPWAAALGTYAAERVVEARRDFDLTFSPARGFVIGPRLQALLTTPLAYAIANGIAKHR